MRNTRISLSVLLGTVLAFSLILPVSAVVASDTVTEAWVARYDCTDKSIDVAEAIAIDGAGNVYVTGTSQGEIVTVKYDSMGTQEWAVRYECQIPSYYGADRAKAIAVDDSGNVYVTGEVMHQDTGIDYVTIKYDTNGNQLWVARYDGIPLPINEFANDYAEAIAVDALGNVYVTGTSAGDYVTVKYDGSGNELWVARYDDPEGQYDRASAIAVDGEGNVHVTGWSVYVGYATVKYNNAGNQLWVVKLPRLDARANAITLDESGNVYVTGYVGGDGYGTVKYDSAGNELWVSYHRTYNISEAYAIAVDDAGNVYVTGADQVGGVGYENYDYATIKYDSDGNQLWLRHYDGPAGGGDLAYALALDAEDNVCVAGVSEGIGSFSDYAIVKYDTNGNELWVARYNGPAGFYDELTSMVVDDWGNVYVTGFAFTNSKEDFATVKYDADGTQLWSAYYDGGVSGRDILRDMVVDSDGSVYVTGQSQGDYATVKYDSSGNQVWVARYDGPAYDDNQDAANAIAVDQQGNVYVTGYSEGIGTWHDIATIKYDSSGNELWVARYDGPRHHSADRGYAIAVDSVGNVYVAGEDWTDAGYHCATIKYDSAGNQLWVRRYDDPGSYALDMEVDSSGNVYVCAVSHVAGSDWSYLVIKYDTDGNELWQARYDSSEKVWDWPRAMVVDDSGNVYVTGTSGHGMVPDSENDYVTVKFDSEGNQAWVARYDSAGEDEAQDIAVDDSGNVYVTGRSGGTWLAEVFMPVGFVYATIKYDSDGNQIWVRTYPEVGTGGAGSIALDGLGNVYVTGGSMGGFATIKYNGDGDELWMAQSYGDEDEWRGAAKVALDELGNVYVAGNTRDRGGWSDYTIIKYVQADAVVGVETATDTGTAFFTPSHGRIDDLEALTVPADPPEDYTFPHGLFSFKVTNLDYDGQTVTLTIELPSPVPAGTKWWKYHDGQWHDYNIPITISGNTITITLTDGGIGDIDGAADGIITDPGGPGNPVSPLTVGWEGFPVNKAAVVAPWIALLAAIAGASLLLLRRRRVLS